MAERIGSKVQDMVKDSHKTDYAKTRVIAETDYAKTRVTAESNTRIAELQETTKRENALLRAEIAKMREETQRANALVSAEAKIQAEKIRAAGQIATAAIMAGDNRGYYGSDSSIPPSRNVGSATRNRVLPGYSETRFCPFCGSDVTAGSFFCRNCGKRIK